MAYTRTATPPDDRTVVVRQYTGENDRDTVALRVVAEPHHDEIRVERATPSGDSKQVTQCIHIDSGDIVAMIDALEDLRECLEDSDA